MNRPDQRSSMVLALATALAFRFGYALGSVLRRISSTQTQAKISDFARNQMARELSYVSPDK